MISQDFLHRIESAAQASPIDSAEVQALLDEALAVPMIHDERDLQDILFALLGLGHRLFETADAAPDLSAFNAAAAIILSALRRGYPPGSAIILSFALHGLGLEDASFQFLADTRAAVQDAGGDDVPLHLAQIDNAIGDQHLMIGDLDLADEHFQLALEEFETRPGGNPALLSSIHSNLGLVRLKKGALKDAGAHLKRALQIDADHGGDSNHTAIILDRLGAVELALARRNGRLFLGGGYINQAVDKHLRNAEHYLDDARAKFELPGAEADYAICLCNVVALARCRNELEIADRYSREALEILERTGDHNALWTAREARVAVLYEQGNWASVVDFFGPIAEVPDDPSVAAAFTYLALAAARMDDMATSFRAASFAADMDDRLIARRIQAISEAEALHLFGPFSDRLEILLGLGLAAKAEGASAEWLYGVALSRTGRLFERFGSAWTRAYSAKGVPADLVERVLKLRATAARLDLDGADASSIFDARRRQEEAAREAGLAEADLLAAVGQEAQTPAPIAPGDVRNALDADTLLLDFAFVQTIEGVRHYAVFIVRDLGPVEFRDLGPVKELDELIFMLEDGLRHRSAKREMFWGDAGDLDSAPGGNSWVEPANKLAALLFSSGLDLTARLRVSPIGLWSMVPFGLLPARGRPLIENHLISHVPSGRWLGARAMSPHTPDDSASPSIVMGNPDYDLVNLSELPFPVQMRFGPLSNAAIEVRELAARLQVEAKTGKEANRDQLASARSPFILHLATHGAMLDAFGSIAEQSDPTAGVMKLVGGIVVTEETSPTEGSLAARIPGFLDDSPQGRHHARVRWLTEIGPRDPSSRSLIVLAGANAWLAGLENPPAFGTGFLTAGEFALTDLSSTQLVVLSACQTGSGAVSIGDGTLLGLRSASLLAGAASCLTALWQVDDEATTDLILAFYAALERGVARDEALQEAQLAVRKERAHPYYWAAWVLDGDNGMLPAWPNSPTEPQEASA